MSRCCVLEAESIKRKSLGSPSRVLLASFNGYLFVTASSAHSASLTIHKKQYGISNVQLPLHYKALVHGLNVPPGFVYQSHPVPTVALHHIASIRLGFIPLPVFLLFSPTPTTATYRALSQPDDAPQCCTAQGGHASQGI
jgi:hypothetical protein